MSPLESKQFDDLALTLFPMGTAVPISPMDLVHICTYYNAVDPLAKLCLLNLRHMPHVELAWLEHAGTWTEFYFIFTGDSAHHRTG